MFNPIPKWNKKGKKKWIKKKEKSFWWQLPIARLSVERTRIRSYEKCRQSLSCVRSYEKCRQSLSCVRSYEKRPISFSTRLWCSCQTDELVSPFISSVANKLFCVGGLQEEWKQAENSSFIPRSYWDSFTENWRSLWRE